MRGTIHHHQSVTERTRSLWAWGWARQVSRRRRTRGARAARACARAAATRRAARAAARRAAPWPRRASRLPDALAAFASQDAARSRRHTRGRAFPDLVAGFAGDFARCARCRRAPARCRRGRARARGLRARGWAVVPFGGGTSVVGGVDAAAARGDREAVVVASISAALAGVREVDATSRLARIGAGTLGPRLEDELARARPDAAPLPAVVRVLDARRLARDPRRRPLRDRPDAHRRSLPRARARHAARHDRDASPSGIGRRARAGCASCSAARARSA